MKLFLISILFVMAEGLYIRLPSSFANSMRYKKSEEDSTVVFTYGITKAGDTVCAAWQYNHFPQFDTIPFDTVTLSIDDF